MRRCFLTLGAFLGTGCGGVPDPKDTELDTDTAPITGCDFSAFAGDWRGEIPQIDLPYAWDVSLTLDTTAEMDGRIGGALYVYLADTPETCASEFFCTGRTRNGWAVAVERVIAHPEVCNDEYAFFRPEADGSLSFEFAASEFSEALGSGSLRRAP